MLGSLLKFIVLFVVFYIIYSLVINAIGIYRKIRRDQAEFRKREPKPKSKDGDSVIELDKDQYKVE